MEQLERQWNSFLLHDPPFLALRTEIDLYCYWQRVVEHDATLLGTSVLAFLGVRTNEACAERAGSHLRQLVSKHRTTLDETLIHSQMVIRMNAQSLGLRINNRHSENENQELSCL